MRVACPGAQLQDFQVQATESRRVFARLAAAKNVAVDVIKRFLRLDEDPLECLAVVPGVDQGLELGDSLLGDPEPEERRKELVDPGHLQASWRVSFRFCMKARLAVSGDTSPRSRSRDSKARQTAAVVSGEP